MTVHGILLISSSHPYWRPIYFTGLVRVLFVLLGQNATTLLEGGVLARGRHSPAQKEFADETLLMPH